MNKINQKGEHKRLFVAGVLILLLSLGMVIDEGDYVTHKQISTTVYLQVYSAFLVLLVYIVPFCFLIKRLCRKYQLDGFVLMIAVACGALIPAAFAGEINDSFTSLMRHLMGRAYSDAWLGSIETGVVEELLKLLTVSALVYLFHRQTLQDYVSIGMCVGMGFQIEEDISYITESGFQHVSSAFPEALDRIVGSLGSHWAYTGLAAIGLYLIVTSMSAHHVRRGMFWIVYVMVNHFLYDSPIGDVNLFFALLNVALILPLIAFLRDDDKKDPMKLLRKDE